MSDPVLRHPTGPIAEPIRNDCPGPWRCGCRPDYAQSCHRCDGATADASELHSYLAAYRRDNEQGSAA